MPGIVDASGSRIYNTKLDSTKVIASQRGGGVPPYIVSIAMYFHFSWLTSAVSGLQGASGNESTIPGLRLLTSPQLQTRIAAPAPISHAPPAWRRSGSRPWTHRPTSHMT